MRKKKNKILSKKSKFLVKKYLDDLDTDLDGIWDELNNDPYKAKKYGEGKVSSFEIKGLIDAFAMVSEWPSGEGYDVSIETKQGSKKDSHWKTKRLSIHLDELECVLRAINDLNIKR